MKSAEPMTTIQTFLPEMPEMLQGIAAGLVLSAVVTVWHTPLKPVSPVALAKAGSCSTFASPGRSATGAARAHEGCQVQALPAKAARLDNPRVARASLYDRNPPDSAPR
jgi:hypothetical protein